MREVNVGLLGCGVVGSALAELIHEEEEAIALSAGVRLNICQTLVRDIDKSRNGLAKRLTFTRELEDIFKQDGLEILVELIGGNDVAREAIEQGLRAGKSVVTANKVVLSRHGEELAEVANESGCSLAYEASVGSCIPILQSLDHTLSSETFHAVVGILNGTTNFILSRMSDGLEYEEALAEAQGNGLAESDPSADVSGSDAAHKLTILTRKAFNVSIGPDAIDVEGIGGVARDDLVFAGHFGYTVKLLAIARRHGERLELRVGPHLVAKDSPFATIRDESNAALLVGQSVGRLFFAGPGAGPRPTARAVLGDILSIATGERACVPGRRELGLPKASVRDANESESRFYLRVTFEDQPHVLATITRILDDCGVQVHRVEAVGAGRGDIVILTHSTTFGAVRLAVNRLQQLSYLRETPRAFPIYNDNINTGEDR